MSSSEQEATGQSQLLQHGRLLKNAFYSLLSFLWPIGLYLVATPFIVHHLGQEGYGLLALIITFLGFVAVLDLGLGTATLKFVAEYHARQEFQRVNEAIGTTLVFYMGLALLSGSAVFAGTPQLIRLFHVPDRLVADATFAFHSVAAGFVINMVLGVLLAIPRALQQYKLASLVGMLTSTGNTLSMVLILALGYGLPQIVVATISINLAAAVFMWFRIRSLLPTFKISLHVEPAVTRQLLTFGLFSFINSLSGIATFYLDKMLIGAALGLGQVTLFTVPFDMAAKLHSLVNSLANAFFPLSSELSSTNNMERLRGIYVSFSRLLLLISSSLAFPLLALSDSFLRLWMGADFAAKAVPTFHVLIIAFFLQTLSIVPFFLINGLGRPQIPAAFGAFNAVANLVLSLVLLRSIGLLGVPVAILITNCPFFIFNTYIEHYYLGLGWTETARVIYPLPLAGGALLVLLFVPYVNPYIPNVLTWLAACVGSMGLMWLLFFSIDKEVRQVATAMRAWSSKRVAGLWPAAAVRNG